MGASIAAGAVGFALCVGATALAIASDETDADRPAATPRGAEIVLADAETGVRVTLGGGMLTLDASGASERTRERLEGGLKVDCRFPDLAALGLRLGQTKTTRFKGFGVDAHLQAGQDVTTVNAPEAPDRIAEGDTASCLVMRLPRSSADDLEFVAEAVNR